MDVRGDIITVLVAEEPETRAETAVGKLNDGKATPYDGVGNLAVCKGEDGTGGLLIIYADTIENNEKGKIESNGSKGGYYYYNSSPETGGGSSGGGSINIFYKSSIIKSGIIVAGGGVANTWGAKGGDGSVTIGSIATGTFAKDS